MYGVLGIYCTLEVCGLTPQTRDIYTSCFHNSCRGKRWKEFVAQIGRPEPHHYDPPLQPRKPRSKSTDRRKQTAQVNEAADDPHRLARLFLADHHANGLLTLRWWREEWFRWDGGAAAPRVTTRRVRHRGFDPDALTE